MPLVLSNQELESVCDMPNAINALFAGLQAFGRGDAVRRPRIDLFAPTARPEEFACFSTMDGLVRGGYYALRLKPDIMSWPAVGGVRRKRNYCVQPGRFGGLIFVFRAENAELVAIMNDGYIQHARVGALAALGARYLARPEAAVVGMLGSGGMARSFAEGFAAVRQVRRIQAYSPSAGHLHTYCAEMSRKLDIEVIPAGSAALALRGADIAAACTNAIEPVVSADMLAPGMYVANVTGWELDTAAVERISVVGYLTQSEPLDISGFRDHHFDVRINTMAYVAGQPDERARIPGGHPRGLPAGGRARHLACVDWATGQPLFQPAAADITSLAELAGGVSRDLTSGGIQGLQFAAVAGRAYELAAARGLGRELPLEWFLQDTPT